MDTYEISRDGRIEIAVRYAISWLLLATLFVVPILLVGLPRFELTIALVVLVALLAYLVVQWLRVVRGKWRITFSGATVELPFVGKAEVESIEAVRRFWRGPGQHCLMVKFRKDDGKFLSRTTTVYPQYYERGSELEARFEALGRHP